MYGNYFNLHKSIINNRLSEKCPNYSLQSTTCVSKFVEYRSLTILTFVAFEKYRWILIQQSMKFVYYHVGKIILITTHKLAIMIHFECQAYKLENIVVNYRQIKCIYKFLEIICIKNVDNWVQF